MATFNTTLFFHVFISDLCRRTDFHRYRYFGNQVSVFLWMDSGIVEKGLKWVSFDGKDRSRNDLHFVFSLHPITRRDYRNHMTDQALFLFDKELRGAATSADFVGFAFVRSH